MLVLLKISRKIKSFLLHHKLNDVRGNIGEKSISKENFFNKLHVALNILECANDTYTRGLPFKIENGSNLHTIKQKTA